jgi:hypothetical protein
MNVFVFGCIKFLKMQKSSAAEKGSETLPVQKSAKT